MAKKRGSKKAAPKKAKAAKKPSAKKAPAKSKKKPAAAKKPAEKAKPAKRRLKHDPKLPMPIIKFAKKGGSRSSNATTSRVRKPVVTDRAKLERHYSSDKSVTLCGKPVSDDILVIFNDQRAVAAVVVTCPTCYTALPPLPTLQDQRAGVSISPTATAATDVEPPVTHEQMNHARRESMGLPTTEPGEAVLPTPEQVIAEQGGTPHAPATGDEPTSGPCGLCQKPDQGPDQYCSGCKKFICNDCERDGAPWGSHKPEDHQRIVVDDGY